MKIRNFPRFEIYFLLKNAKLKPICILNKVSNVT